MVDGDEEVDTILFESMSVLLFSLFGCWGFAVLRCCFLVQDLQTCPVSGVVRVLKLSGKLEMRKVHRQSQ